MTPSSPPPEQAEVRSEWRAAVGGQFEEASHGILDAGWRKGPVSVQLFTDTLDLRAALRGDHGAVAIGLRATAFAADMWITPWRDGAPDPSRAQRVASVGPDLRAERWLPLGIYLAVESSARWYSFVALPDALVEVPDQGWLRLDTIVGGWWARGRLSGELALGLDQTTTPLLSPHIHLELLAHPDGALAPIGEWRCVLAASQDDVIATRIGGMTPYHVPLAGAAWAEFWAEDLCAARSGLIAHRGPVSLGFVLDAAGWVYPERSLVSAQAAQRDAAAGVALVGRIDAGGWFGDLSVGRATIRRPEGMFPISVWFSAGSTWRSAGKRQEK